VERDQRGEAGGERDLGGHSRFSVIDRAATGQGAGWHGAHRQHAFDGGDAPMMASSTGLSTSTSV
jgi:hypothetical protein